MSRSDAHVGGRLSHPPTVLLLALGTEVAISVLPGTVASIPTIGQVIGVALIGVGFALNVVAARRFDRSGTPIRPGTEALVLVTEGVFRRTRNPMYLGMLLIIAGAALALATPWALAVLPVFVAWVSRLIRSEEARLEDTFGDVYRAYRRRVRRWL